MPRPGIRVPAADRKKEIVDAIAYAFGHWIRLEALAILAEGKSSVAEIARIIGISVNRLSGHIRGLYEHGCIEYLGTGTSRNANEHYYRALVLPYISDEEFRAMPPVERRESLGIVTQAVLAETLAALRAGKFDDDENTRIIGRFLRVDARGKIEVQDHVLDVYRHLVDIKVKNAHRISESGETGTTTIISVTGFERHRPHLPHAEHTSAREVASGQNRIPASDRTKDVADGVAYAAGNEIRVDALEILAEGKISVAEMAKALGVDLRKLSGHIRYLYAYGRIEDAGIEKVRNTNKHFYRAVTLPCMVTAYDGLGRPIEYLDADGNLSKITYDLLGRPATTNDGKGTQTFTYDANSGLLVKLEDSAAGTFTAAYDADGSLIQQGLPNGLLATRAYDEAGTPTDLTYTKVTNCSVNCTWLDFDVEESIHGQVLAQANTLSSQQYEYDKAGRLKLTKDTTKAGSCTTRAYSFDKNSNRTALVTRPPKAGGACDTTSTGTTQSYTYDAADRLTASGIAYDDYGRITSLPAAYAGGATLTTSYFDNDMVRSQTQSGVTNTYELDSAMRPRQVTQSGTKTGTEVFHYAGGSDAPAWTQRGSAWTRNIGGIGGELAAIQDSTTGTSLQLPNLHGDIVATASLSQTATGLTATFEFDEFGNPKQTGSPRFGWLGGKQRRAELPSGVIQMGVRSYVPAMGRFISVDPVLGGSSNAYDYTDADPVNGLDLDGRVSGCGFSRVSVSSRNHRIYAVAQYRCDSSAWPFGHSLMKFEVRFERHSKGWFDELIYGPFETKGHWNWTPRNSSDPRWRTLGTHENWWCGDLGREYQITYILTIKYSSPVNGIIKSETKELKQSGRAVCSR